MKNFRYIAAVSGALILAAILVVRISSCASLSWDPGSPASPSPPAIPRPIPVEPPYGAPPFQAPSMEGDAGPPPA